MSHARQITTRAHAEGASAAREARPGDAASGARPVHRIEPASDPLLLLQTAFGNHAVQRALNHGPPTERLPRGGPAEERAADRLVAGRDPVSRGRPARTASATLGLGAGQPLHRGVRANLLAELGGGVAADLAEVRVHTGPRADAAARGAGSRAFAAGRDVVFADGQFAPHTTAGRALLRHEVAHTLTPQPSGAPANRLLRSEVNYVQQVTGDDAAGYYAAFDASLDQIQATVKTAAQTPETQELGEAAAQLKELRGKGRVTCWHATGGMHYASYHNPTGEVRLHVNWGGKATNPGTLVHEAIHALHASRYPKLSRLYGSTKTAGQPVAGQLARWKAWTEYWAYRRTIEYDNLRQEPQFRRSDVHEAALTEPGVKKAVGFVKTVTGEEFDPSTWTPPGGVAPPAKRR
jgi:uncharacterized protein DUF4157